MTTITLNSGDSVYGTLSIESSVDSATGTKGLFSFLPLYLSLPLVGVAIIGAVVLALRMKKSGELTDSGEELVAPDAFVNPDHLGTRRDDALDIGYAVDEIASGEVSSDEIAAALAQSLQMPLPTSPSAVPMGLPPGAASLKPLQFHKDSLQPECRRRLCHYFQFHNRCQCQHPLLFKSQHLR